MTTSPDNPTLADLVVRLAELLERLGIPYAFGGALAVSFWGIPRTTQDADCLVAVPALAYQRLADTLNNEGFTVAEQGEEPVTVEALRKQVAVRGYMTLSWRSTLVELFVPLVTLQHEILRRATPQPFGDGHIIVTTAEDLILLKMAFHRQKDVQDIKGILHIQARRLDFDYLQRWSQQMLDDPLIQELETLIADYIY